MGRGSGDGTGIRRAVRRARGSRLAVHGAAGRGRVGGQYGRQQCARVGHARVLENGGRGPQLDDAPEVHDGDAGRDLRDDREVVRNVEIGEGVVALEVLQQVDDLRLDRDVERGHRLVAHDEVRPHCECTGDPDTLPLATGELVGVSLGELRAQANFAQGLNHAVVRLAAGRELMDEETLANRVTDRAPRVERRVWILEDQLHPPSQLAERLGTERQHVGPVERHRAGRHRDEPQQRARGGRLAASRFPDERQRFAPRNREGDAIHRTHQSARAAEHAL